PFETDESAATPPPHSAYRVTTRISIRDETSISLPSREEVERLLALPSPPSLPLSPWSSPLPQIPSSTLPVLRLQLPASPTYPLGYRAAMIKMRAKTPSLSYSPPSGTPLLLPILAPTSSPSLLLPSTDHEADRPEVEESSSAPAARITGGLRADYGFITTLDREIRRDPKREVGYGITNTWDDMVEGTRAHACIARLMEAKARMSREAWGRSMDASDLAHVEFMSLHTTVLGQQTLITELQAVDRRRQAAITEMLAVDHRRQAQLIEVLKLLKRLQTQMTEFERQHGPAKGPAQPDALEEADSSS
ncbi:hypothetical protein Tco_1034135, partial [Tanacetum coccineum]